MAEVIDVSENFSWHSGSGRFKDKRTGHEYSESEPLGKIAVFEDRVKTWFLNVALEQCAREPSPGDYVALSVAISYIEGIEHYRRGVPAPPGHASRWFVESARRVFNSVADPVLRELWRSVRCGLFHSGFTEGPTLLMRTRQEALWIVGKTLHINPRIFVEATIADFDKYIHDVRHGATAELVGNFIRLWDERWENT